MGLQFQVIYACSNSSLQYYWLKMKKKLIKATQVISKYFDFHFLILEYPTLAALEKKDSGQDKMEQDEPDNDNVFEEATKSEVINMIE